MTPLVEILLSTYNGEKYLEVQLDSICKQDYTNWKLLVRDDGSTDRTIQILNSFIQKYPQKILLHNDSDGNVGYSRSFSKLLKQSTADYVMYCDQDDYWHSSKTSTMLSIMLEKEAELPGMAHIIFSDLQLTDSELNVTSPSLFKITRYSEQKDMRIFFLKNYIPGCNLLFNKILLQQALKTDNIINLHDHWLLMVCSSVGKISFVNKPLIKYRIHSNNAIGFKGKRDSFLKDFQLSFKNILKYGFFNKKYRLLLYERNIQQIKNICEQLPAIVSKDAISFAQIDKTNYFNRKIKNIIKPYILESSLLKQLTYIICF
jgi:glycosyltransferase involved in cell wall biosynthesis